MGRKEAHEDACFEECTCRCGQRLSVFDQVLREETKWMFTLRDVTHSNIGWYLDRNQSPTGLDFYEVSKLRVGVYVLWYKDDYCSKHERFHMKALYVGKGQVGRRLREHFKNKNTKENMLVYFSFFECSNRVAKYVEQLLLDLYDFPLNFSENSGAHKLCEYFAQDEVD